MTAVARLVTHVDTDDDSHHPGQMHVSACHEAVLADGRRILLLDDRGWTSSLRVAGGGNATDVPDIWALTSVEDIEQEARTVVGPDEPPEGRSQEEAEADHWRYLADTLRRHGVAAEGPELRRLPHDVVLSERLLARLRPGPGAASTP